ncbi:class I SAM-dependent methyltransferase [Burkholderia latens]|uniref:Class I SAM-dependent methyltransferase n=1 Tax=Burkholderia latens TaxID=488446 RepID=A0A6H9TWY8_9BURK|nr:class I SAM-dependent methyltransferase [Burkholderia latens]KAB0644780.1 class I SAM-dependent methyltransferase [Burkholderia latens]VWB17688.1 UbiE/COQ5 family methyltransferase [Burkholderia latens]
MANPFDDNETVSAFAALSEYGKSTGTLQWDLAYPAVFEALGLAQALEGPLLDYGCGPGYVARHVAQRFGQRVIAVDPSTPAIAHAIQYQSHPNITFHHIAGPRVDHLSDASVAAAMCCFVLGEVPRPEDQLAICREIHRLLRQGGVLALITAHPETVGVQFSSCRRGEPGKRYAAGDPMTVYLHGPGGDVTLQNYYWPTSHYLSLLSSAGFEDIRQHDVHLAAGASPGQPPYLLLHARAG